jgi:electron transport complex protein RnfD
MKEKRREPEAAMPEGGGSMKTGGLVLSSAPHLGVHSSSARMSWLVAAGLLPAAAWGVFLFGVPAALVLAVSVGSALLAELLSSLLFKRLTVSDGSAVLTGLLVGLFMSPATPLHVPAAASVFAILVVKQSFGGLGRNWMNPAMGGVLFGLLSWPGAMSRWAAALGAAGNLPALPPLDALRAALPSATQGSPLAVLASSGYRFSDLDAGIVSWINTHILSFREGVLQPGTFDMLIGHASGRIGEISVPLLLLGAAFLLRKGIIRWQVPVAFTATFFLLTLVLGGIATGRNWLAGGPGFNLFSGSIALGAFFVAGDPVTSPLTGGGRWIYGICVGSLAFGMRFFGSLGDGVVVAIVLGNCVVPLIDRWLGRRGGAPAWKDAR